jgi:hypothetical protein
MQATLPTEAAGPVTVAAPDLDRLQELYDRGMYFRA